MYNKNSKKMCNVWITMPDDVLIDKQHFHVSSRFFMVPTLINAGAWVHRIIGMLFLEYGTKADKNYLTCIYPDIHSNIVLEQKHVSLCHFHNLLEKVALSQELYCIMVQIEFRWLSLMPSLIPATSKTWEITKFSWPRFVFDELIKEYASAMDFVAPTPFTYVRFWKNEKWIPVSCLVNQHCIP